MTDSSDFPFKTCELPDGARMIVGGADDLDSALTWLRGTLHASLGPEVGEEVLRQVSMAEAMASYLVALEAPLEA